MIKLPAQSRRCRLSGEGALCPGEWLHFRGQLRVAPQIAGEALDPARNRLEIPWQVVEPGARRRNDEIGRQECCKLSVDVGGRLGKHGRLNTLETRTYCTPLLQHGEHDRCDPICHLTQRSAPCLQKLAEVSLAARKRHFRGQEAFSECALRQPIGERQRQR